MNLPMFRAWDIKKKVMRTVNEISFNINSIQCEPKDGIDSSLEMYDPICSNGEFELMQFTSFKDKNGNEIFVGDIVRHSNVATDISIVRLGEFGVPNIEEQGYQDMAFGFYFENASELKDVAPFNMTVPLNTSYVEGIIVVGNIYENEDMLRGEKASD